MEEDTQQILALCGKLAPAKLALIERMLFLLISGEETKIAAFNSIVNPHLEAGTLTSEVLRKALDSAEEVEP